MTRSMPNAPAGVTITVPEGTRHYTTTVVAESWEAFDALPEEQGWKERQWCVDSDHKQVPCSSPACARVHLQKELDLGGVSRLVCFPPVEGREARR